jgi:hypothetical protein
MSIGTHGTYAFIPILGKNVPFNYAPELTLDTYITTFIFIKASAVLAVESSFEFGRNKCFNQGIYQKPLN